MGTRNLTLVQKDNEIKVAQYGQWDGYPEGNGVKILQFCSNRDNLTKLKVALDKVAYYNEREAEIMQKLIDTKDKKALYYFDRYNSRDIGADILNVIISSDLDKIYLVNQYDFGYNSLRCEWAYLINFDTNKLEVYSGFVKQATEQSNRFFREKPYCTVDGDTYYGISLLKEYDLDNLPEEHIFIEELQALDETKFKDDEEVNNNGKQTD